MPDWRSWKLADWNAALVRTVFFDESRLSRPLTRIQAGGSFLATCAGDPAADPAAVQRAIIASFVSNTHRIRTHFAHCVPLAEKTAHLGYPSAFADLYITLLAAGADHSTYGEGNFRKRFAELLYPLQISAPILADCLVFGATSLTGVSAELSKAPATGWWCPPPPGNETLIGYSKRLAFPAYADEIRLERTLQAAGIDFRAGFSAVARAVSHRRSSFSPVFQEEFDAFSRLAAAQKQREFYESPLLGSHQIDHLAPGAQRVGPQWHVPSFSRCRRSYLPRIPSFADNTDRIGIHAVLARSTGGWTPERLLAADQGRLAVGRLWALLRRGCLALFPARQATLSGLAPAPVY